MPGDTSQDHTPDLSTIAYKAEQQCAALVALVERLTEAYGDDEPESRRIMQAIARLLAPILDQISTLSEQLPPIRQEEGQP